MNSCIKSIVAEIEELKKTWLGEAAQAFMTGFEGDKLTFERHTSEYKKLNQALQAVGKAYHTGDQETLSGMSKIKC